MDEHEWLTGDDPARMLHWITCSGPSGSGEADLERWRRRPSDRKLRLFACAVCRQVWDRLTDPRSRQAVEVAERFADGEVNEAVRSRAWSDAVSANDRTIRGTLGPDRPASYMAMYACSDKLYDINATTDFPELLAPDGRAALLRDLVGNPWRPISVETSPGSWVVSTVKGTGELTFAQRTNPTVLAIARRAYDEHCPADSLAVLADALEDAGCASEDLLRHLRGQERAVCRRCEGDGKAHGADRPFEWSADVDYGKCVVCKGSGVGTDWMPLRGPHARGCWAIDLILGKE